MGVRSTKGAVELSPAFKALARDDSAAVIVEVSLDDVTAVVVGRGSRGLSYSHPTDLVGRRSGYTCGRTLMIGADKGAGDFPRDLVEAMRDPAQRAKVTVIVDSDMVGGRSFDDVSRRRCLQQPW